MTKKKKTNWGLIGAIAGVCAAPFTGGTSLALTAAACGGIGFAGGKVLEGAGLVSGDNDGDDDHLAQNMEAWKIQNEQWKTQMEANRAEVERLRHERQEIENNIKQNNEEITRLNAVINNPHSTKDEKDNAKKRLVLLETEIENIKARTKIIDKDIENKSKTPPPPTQPSSWSLPKLKLVDKVLIAGGVVLLIYLMIPEKKKS